MDQHHSVSRLSDGNKHTIISAMGLWGHGDEIAVEVTTRQGHRELRSSATILLTDEQVEIIEEMVETAWLLFEENAVDLRERGESEN